MKKLKILSILLFFTIASINLLANNSVTISVNKNKKISKGYFETNNKQKGQIFTLTVTPEIEPNDKIEKIVNKADGCVMILMSEDAGKNGSLSFQAIELDWKVGSFNMVTTGKVITGKSNNGNKGSLCSSNWAFSGTGFGKLICTNRLNDNYIFLSFDPSIDSLKEVGCNIDTASGSFSMSVIPSNSLDDLIKKLKKTFFIVCRDGYSFYESGMFNEDVKKDYKKSFKSDTCLKCKGDMFLKSMTFKYLVDSPTIYIGNWKEANSSGPKTKKIYDAIIKDIMIHENVHFEDLINSYSIYLKPIRYEKTCCKNADLVDYNYLCNTDASTIFRQEIIDQNLIYDHCIQDFHDASDELHKRDPFKELSDEEKKIKLTK